MGDYLCINEYWRTFKEGAETPTALLGRQQGESRPLDHIYNEGLEILTVLHPNYNSLLVDARFRPAESCPSNCVHTGGEGAHLSDSGVKLEDLNTGLVFLPSKF